MTQEKKQKTSIDDETASQWDSINFTKSGSASKFQVQWLDEEDVPNEHPVFGNPDMVESPPHYNNGSIECIEAIEAMLTKDEYIGYLRGNALKYMWRFRYKNKPFQDLRKARWYEERLMKFLLDNQDAV